MPWAGDITQIPPGWIKCDGTTLNTNDYPVLFEIIGYRYGGDADSFATPRLLSRSIADFHSSHQNISGIGMPNNFVSRIGIDEANSTSGTVSSIDLNVSISTLSNFSGSITGTTLNPPSYFDVVSVVPRLLGDHHTPSHSHSTETGYNSVGAPSQWVESCQGNFFTNCAFDCPDDCETLAFYAAEQNAGSNSLERSSLVVPESASGNTLGHRLGFPDNRNNSATGQLSVSNTPTRNFLLDSDDTIEANNNDSSGVRFGYPVTLNTNAVNFVGTAVGHSHDSLDFSITQGSMRTPNVININTISTGSVTPINQTNVGIASIRVDNIDTPSLSIIHIIRAY